jgi:type VI secretion system protein
MRNRYRASTLGWIGGLIALLLSACGGGGLSRDDGNNSRVQTRLIAVDVAPTANLNHPIAMDLLVIYNRALFEDLLKISANEWFEKRAQYKLDYPSLLQSWEWELVPGQVVPFFKLPPGTRKAVGALIFANYVSPGNHRARIDPFQGVVVRLKENEFTVMPLLE